MLVDDSDADGDDLSIVWGTPPIGSTIDDAGGIATWTPPPEFSGTQDVPYQVCDSTGRCTDAVVTVIIALAMWL